MMQFKNAPEWTHLNHKIAKLFFVMTDCIAYDNAHLPAMSASAIGALIVLIYFEF